MNTQFKRISLSWPAIFFAVLSSLGFFVVMIITSKRGVGMPSDAPSYIYMASHLNYFYPDKDILMQRHLLWEHFPPLFPCLLAVIERFAGLGLQFAARWLNALLFSCNMFLVCLVINRYTRSVWLSILGSLFMLFSADILRIHSAALSEPLSIFLMLLWLLLFMGYIENSSLPSLLGCSVVAAAACLTKFTGIAIIFTGIAGILFFKKRSIRDCSIPLLIYVCVSLSTTFFWMARNFFAAGVLTDRQVAFHFSSLLNSNKSGVFALISISSVPYGLRWLYLDFMIVMFCIGWFLWTKRDKRPPADIAQAGIRANFILALFIFIYILALIITMVFLDAMVESSARIMLPVSIGIMLYCLIFVSILLSSVKNFKIIKIVFVALFSFLIIGTNSSRAVKWSLIRYKSGEGYEGDRWDNSEIIQEVKKIPKGIFIYTNNFNALYVRAGRESSEFVPKIDPLTTKMNPRYPGALKQMTEDLRDRKAVIVYCFSSCLVCGLPSVDDLMEKIPLKLVSRVSDGAIYAWDDKNPSGKPLVP